METVKKNIGSLTFKWKKNKIKGNIGSYADKEGETQRCRDMLNWNVKNHYGNRKMKEQEIEYRYYGNRKMKKEERQHRSLGLWKGKKNINYFKSKFHNI